MNPFPMILDTDTYNEIDDQFALIYSLLAPEKIELRGVTAAPFLNERSVSPGDGMWKSHGEIRRILELMDREEVRVEPGSETFLADRRTPVPSAAAEFIIEESHRMSAEGRKLYIGAIAALTNVGSALLLDPTLRERIEVVWLGGHDYTYPDNREFNLREDVAAAQILFSCRVPLIHIPCRNVASALSTTSPELAKELSGAGAAGDYLQAIFDDYLLEHNCADKVIWDIAVPGYFAIPEATEWNRIPAPVLNSDRSWFLPESGHEITVARKMNPSMVFGDLFRRLRAASLQPAEEKTV